MQWHVDTVINFEGLQLKLGNRYLFVCVFLVLHEDLARLCWSPVFVLSMNVRNSFWWSFSSTLFTLYILQHPSKRECCLSKNQPLELQPPYRLTHHKQYLHQGVPLFRKHKFILTFSVDNWRVISINLKKSLHCGF